MRSRKIYIGAILLLFVVMQVVPLYGSDRPPIVVEPEDPVYDPIGGEGHPWQDNNGGDDGSVSNGKTSINEVISQIVSFFTGKTKTPPKHKNVVKKNKPSKNSELLSRKYK